MLFRKLFDNREQPVEINENLLRAITNAIEAHPKEFVNYWSRGRVYDYLGKYQQAISDYTRVISLNPNFLGAYINRGADYVHFDDIGRAVEDFNRAIQIASDNAMTYHNRSYCHYRSGEFEAAYQDASQAIQRDPEFPDAYIARARISLDARLGSPQ